MNSINRIKYKHGTRVPTQNEATYLGANLHFTSAPVHELNKIMRETSVIWNKCDNYGSKPKSQLTKRSLTTTRS